MSNQKRLLGEVALAALIVTGLLIMCGVASYGSGWSRGYTTGRLSASDGGVIPYTPYRHPGQLFAPLLCSAGLLVLLLIAAGRFFHFWAWKAARGQGKERLKHRHRPMPFWCRWGWEEPSEEPDTETGEVEPET